MDMISNWIGTLSSLVTKLNFLRSKFTCSMIHKVHVSALTVSCNLVCTKGDGGDGWKPLNVPALGTCQ
jgi:hypothetical protein